MATDEIELKLDSLLKNALKIDSVPSNLSVENCQKWDSLVHLTICILLEEEFGLDVRASNAHDLMSRQDILKQLRSQY